MSCPKNRSEITMVSLVPNVYKKGTTEMPQGGDGSGRNRNVNGGGGGTAVATYSSTTTTIVTLTSSITSSTILLFTATFITTREALGKWSMEVV